MLGTCFNCLKVSHKMPDRGLAANHHRRFALLLSLGLHWTFATDTQGATLNQCLHANGRIEFTDRTCPPDTTSTALQGKNNRDSTRSETGTAGAAPPRFSQRPPELTPAAPRQDVRQTRSEAANGLPAEDRLKSCDPGIALAAADEIVRHPDSLKEPLQLFPAAFAFFQNGRKDEGVFWFYAAQLRTRQQLVLEQGDRGQILSIMLMTMGPIINNHALQNTMNLSRILDRVLEWDKGASNPFQENARLRKLDRQIDQVYAGLNDFKAKLLTDRTTLETAARQAAASIEQTQAQMNSQRCRKDQPDPALERQTLEREWVQITEFIRTHQEVVQKVGRVKHVGPESSTRKAGEALPSRYIASVGGDRSTYAVIDVARTAGGTRFTLACFTALSLGSREAFKDECKQ